MNTKRAIHIAPVGLPHDRIFIGKFSGPANVRGSPAAACASRGRLVQPQDCSRFPSVVDLRVWNLRKIKSSTIGDSVASAGRALYDEHRASSWPAYKRSG
jgi:hypothetical protein